MNGEIMVKKGQTKHWYIAQTYAGSERNVAEDIMHRAKTLDVEQYIFETLVPTTKVSVRNPKTNALEEKEELLYPGYIYISMILDEEGKAWFVVRNTAKVTGILGSSGKQALPVPVPKHDMQAIFDKIGRTEIPSLTPWIGKLVEVISGSLKGQRMNIVDVSDAKKVLYSEIDVFGSYQKLEIDPKTVREVK
jgi:transcriptional antiterminator NusG